MAPIITFIAILGMLGVAFFLLHLIISFLGLSDLVALLLFAAPVTAVLAYCTEESKQKMITTALKIYGSFVSVVLCAAALVYYIGE